MMESVFTLTFKMTNTNTTHPSNGYFTLGATGRPYKFPSFPQAPLEPPVLFQIQDSQAPFFFFFTPTSSQEAIAPSIRAGVHNSFQSSINLDQSRRSRTF